VIKREKNNSDLDGKFLYKVKVSKKKKLGTYQSTYYPDFEFEVVGDNLSDVYEELEHYY